MSIEVSYGQLADTIVEKLGVPFFAAQNTPFTASWDWGNWACVTASLPGRHSSPYPGWVRFDPFAPETLELTHDFLRFLSRESGLTIPDLTDDDPLLRLIVEIVSNDDAGDRFFEVLTDQVREKEFNLEAALGALQAEAETLLPGAEAWELSEVQKHELGALLGKLATEEMLRVDAKVRLRENRWLNVVHDHRHYLLFGQNRERIAPKSWFDATWEFIQRFRCNFGVFITEAMLYDKVTIVGAENALVPVSREDQRFLEEYTGYAELEDGSKERWRQVERLNVVNAEQLAALLQDRIDRGFCFEGGEIPPLE